MRLAMRPRFLTYVGNDRGMLDLLSTCLDASMYRIEHCRAEEWTLDAVTPSWRCERVVLIDHFETTVARRVLEELAQHDAGVPVVVMVETASRSRMTVAGAARLHGADRIVLKPVEDVSLLRYAIEAAFRRLDHWRARLEQPCGLDNAVPITETINGFGSMGAPNGGASSGIGGRAANEFAPC
jgi:DNA-binding NtrC family response regulator